MGRHLVTTALLAGVLTLGAAACGGEGSEEEESEGAKVA